MIKDRINVLEVFTFCFLFICIFFPGDPYNLKIVFFFILCIFGIRAFIIQIKRCNCIDVLFMGSIYPIILMLWSVLLTGNISMAISGAYPAVLILLVIIVKEYKINYEKNMMFLLQLLAIATIAIVFLDIIGISSVNGSNALRNFFYQYDMGLMGKSVAYAAYYKVFFKASPLLLIFLPYCFEKGKTGMAFVALIALYLSGTRANIFIATVIFLFGIINIWSENKKNYRIRMFIGVVIIAMAIFSVPIIISVIVDMMSASGAVSSDAVRMGQMRSFVNVFKDPVKLFFGMGFGSEFYDEGRMVYAAASEMSYFDLLRKIGILWFIPFICFIVKPFMCKIGIHLKVAYLGYLIGAATNPLLFSSTAYVLYIYLYTLEKKQICNTGKEKQRNILLETENF